MAINKNFVIKNGLEVNTNVLVAAADEKQVGIGTTRPYYKLHVGGGEGSRGGIGATDLTISGIATIGVAHSDSGAFSVLGISTFQGDIDLLGSAGVSTVRWDASKDAIIFQDNATARFGTGEDLHIWHDGTNSYISDKGTGSLIIGGTDETLAVFTDDGSIQLYHNNTKVFETTGLGVTTYGDVVVSGVTTSARLLVTGISTFTGNVDANGGITANTVKVEDLTNNRVIIAGTGGELEDSADLTFDGTTLAIDAIIDSNDATESNSATSGSVQLAGGLGVVKNIYTSGGVFVTGSAGLTVSSGDVTLGSGVTITNAGNIAAAGIVTANGGIRVGTAITVDANTGNVAVSGILTVGGNLQVTGDITYDEISGRNLNITGITTLADTVNVNGDINLGNATSDTITATGRFDSDLFPASDGAYDLGGASNEWKDLFVDGVGRIDSLEADTAKIADLTDNRVVFAGSSGELEDSSNLTFDGDKLFAGVPINVSTGATITNAGNIAAAGIVTANGGVKVGTAVTLHANGNLGITGILTAGRFIGIHTSTDGGGVGIASTTAHVAYGVTYIDFKGPGVSTVYYSAVTGVSTVYFQGGGGSSVGAAGTWQNDGTPGISTAKSVGINTNSINDGDLQGRPYVGAAGSFQGLYIGNGMVVNDNQLNGDHYIGTAFGGMMVGPVTINGVLTIDGNYAVV